MKLSHAANKHGYSRVSFSLHDITLERQWPYGIETALKLHITASQAHADGLQGWSLPACMPAVKSIDGHKTTAMLKAKLLCTIVEQPMTVI